MLTPEAQKELKELREEIENKASNGHKKEGDKDDEEEDDDEDEDENEEEEEGEGEKENVENTPVKKKEVKQEAERIDDDEDEENDEENVAQLYDEATMPLEEVLKRYSSTENKVKKALKNKGIFKQTVGRPSPMIAAAGSSGSTASSSSKLKKKQLKSSLDDADTKDVEAGDEKPLDFQKQEEEDICEIKKNGTLVNDSSENVNSSAQNHEQDYDEASNLVRIK